MLTLDQKLQLILNQITDQRMAYQAVLWIQDIKNELKNIESLQNELNSANKTIKELRTEIDALSLREVVSHTDVGMGGEALSREASPTPVAKTRATRKKNET
jgi:hypothetical protein